jgi:hypothetical protein
MKSLLYSAIFTILVVLVSSCWENGQFGIRGEGPIVERKVSLDKIKGISLPGSAKVYLTQGTSQEVKIVGQENIIDNLNLEVRGEVWNMGNKRPVWHSETLKIYITMEDLRLIRISGSGDVQSVNHFSNQKELDIRISGSGKMNLDIDATDISANISGSGDLFMNGTADDLELFISGSGTIKAFGLSAGNAKVRISGSGGTELTVKDRLVARVSGSGNVTYKGDPRVDSSISGSGSVRAR